VTQKSELTVQQCHTEAATCRALAQQVMTQAHRVMLEHIAGTWERIARDISDRSPEA
jgi:hypothetical protein